ELPNARAAVTTLLEQDDAAAAAEIVIGLWPAWLREGTWAEPEALSSRLLARDDIPERLRARLHCVLGPCLVENGRTQEAFAPMREVMALMKASPDPAVEILFRGSLVSLLGAQL